MNAATDRLRYRRLPWRKWYGLKLWKDLRADQLQRFPWCQPCALVGNRTAATEVNHREPHHGNWDKFFAAELESCCKPHHDAAIQAAELRGYRSTPGRDGWPVDPKHPINKKRGT